MANFLISDAIFYNWRSRYGGMEVWDARQLKSVEDENRRLEVYQRSRRLNDLHARNRTVGFRPRTRRSSICSAMTTSGAAREFRYPARTANPT
ncbi:MAG: hypothetical protein E5X43_02080 [Mesorhizobium sp.]|nr:MAG: hypothetical protein EOR45_32455 [Mesorhizobium sp.]TJX07159.1 MAG: hypothetical protein E5X43_02080 [Mesorhizobium sp.]